MSFWKEGSKRVFVVCLVPGKTSTSPLIKRNGDLKELRSFPRQMKAEPEANPGVSDYWVQWWLSPGFTPEGDGGRATLGETTG